MKTALSLEQIHALVRERFPELEREKNTNSTSYFLGKKSVLNRIFRLKSAPRGLWDLKLAQSHASGGDRSLERVESVESLAALIKHEISLLQDRTGKSSSQTPMTSSGSTSAFSGYTGAPPNAFAMGIIRSLEKEGFTVAATTQGPVKAQRRTLRITWRGIYIGLMSEQLWLSKVPYACLYRFPKEGVKVSIAKAPQDFEKYAFARDHGCDPDRLHVYTDYSGSYLWIEDEATSLLLMRDWARRIDAAFFPPESSLDAANIQEDLQTILTDKSKSETERLAEVAVRLGQGQFRADLEQEFNSACAVTRLTVLSALRASHIVPWKHSTDAQRLDPKNGLLLSANLDALFDRYMITFRPDGKLAVSKSMTHCDLNKLGPLQDLENKPCERRAAYLMLHNAEFDRLEERRVEFVSASSQSLGDR
ncbi:HNH endonuclease [Cupriavidus sp. 2TAF22]|uniref:HNH endonuclease n=1 Tax=unclassified Cupriavidus TaxID=2640874 RepID=UPI003F902D9B